MRATRAFVRISAPNDARARRDRVAHGAHPALRHGPCPQVPVAHVADRVVGHDVAGPGLVWAGPRADQPVERHDRLDLVALEEPVEDVHDAHRHQARDVADRLHVEAAEPPGQSELLVEIRGLLRSHRGRDRHQHRPEDVGQAADPGVPPLDRVGVLLRELRERFEVRLGVVVVLDDAPAIGEREEVGAHGIGLVAVLGEAKVPLDGVGHQAHHVAERGHLELGRLGPRRHGVGGAADLVSCFEDDRSGARPGEIRAGDEAVVASADHDRVVAVGAGGACGAGAAGGAGHGSSGPGRAGLEPSGTGRYA